MKKLQANMSHVGTCYRCGSKHPAEACRFKNVECHYCHKRGHLAKVCPKKMVDFKLRPKSVGSNKDSTFKAKSVATNSLDEPGQGEEEDVYTMYPTVHKKIKPVKVVVHINDKPVEMEVDTGVSLTVINKSIFDQIQEKNKNLILQLTSVKFRTKGRVVRNRTFVFKGMSVT